MNLLLSTMQLNLLFAPNVLSTDADAIAGVVLSWIGQALVFGSLLAIVTWLLLSTALRRARPAIHAVFWLIVIAKFLLPIGPGWNYSLASMTSTLAPWLGSMNAPVQAPQPAPQPSNLGTLFFYFIPTTQTPVAAPSAPLVQSSATNAAKLPRVSTLIACAYLIGLMLVVGIRLYQYGRFVRMTRRMPLADGRVVELVAETAARLQLRCMPTVRISDMAPAPFVIGAWRPTLVLSNENLRRTEECEAVILHELAHLRRHDLLVRYAQWLAGTLLYFWPVVAWVNRRIDLAREAACDEWALRHGRLSPAEYARCLLRCMRPRRFALTPYAPAAMAANAAHVERRIEMILNSPSSMRRNRMTMLLGATALCGWTGFVMSGASAALPSAATEDANKSAKSPNWFAKYGALNFFLPSVADSLDDDADDELAAISMDAAVSSFVGTPHFVAGMPLDITQLTRVPGLNTDDATIELKIVADGATAGTPQMFFMHANGDQFATNIGVDADGNGSISSEEHDAYLLALAMRDPAAVLAKYPQADSNNDGTLSTDEASSLIQPQFVAGMPINVNVAEALANVAGGPDAPKIFVSVPGKPIGVIGGGMGPISSDDEPKPVGDVQVLTSVASPDAPNGEQTIIVKAVAAVSGATAGAEPRVMVFKAGDESESASAQSITVCEDATASTAGSRKMKITVTNNKGVVRTETTEQEGDGEPKVTVSEAPAAGGDVTIASSAVGVPILSHVPVISTFFKEGACSEAQEPAAAWLIENAAKANKPVTADEVRKFTATASDAGLKRFLRQHPKADTNKDGVLTIAERDAFQSKMQTRRQKAMLKRYPEADKDKNGALTDEEIREFFKNRSAPTTENSSAAGETVTVEGGPSVRVIKTATVNGDGKVEVKVMTTPEAKDGPR